jgi:hypothetical protein
MTDAQRDALQKLADRYNVPFFEGDFRLAFDLPKEWLAGWVGPICVGVSPEGEVHS